MPTISAIAIRKHPTQHSSQNPANLTPVFFPPMILSVEPILKYCVTVVATEVRLGTNVPRDEQPRLGVVGGAAGPSQLGA